MGVQFTLNPAMPVLLRPDGFVQVGWDPRRAVLVRTPGGLTADGLAAVLHTMQSRVSMADLLSHAADLVSVTKTSWSTWSVSSSPRTWPHGFRRCGAAGR